MTSNGDVYFVWLTDGSYHVYLQKLNSEGVSQFSDGGMLISDNNNSSWIAVYHLNLAIDDENNAIITFVDQRSGTWQVYAYKVSPNGQMLWGENGLSISNSSSDNISPRLVVLQDNSVAVSWSQNYTSIAMQRISSDGELLWGDGIIISNLMASLLSPHPIINSNGDLLLQWISQTGQVWAADSKLYLQKYNYDGSAVWSEPTTVVGPVVLPMGNWLQESIGNDNSGSYSAWTEMAGNTQNAFVQYIDDSGELLFSDGLKLSSNSNNFHINPRLVFETTSQSLFSVWNESNGSQSQRGVYAQRIDVEGNKLWGINGIDIIPLNTVYDYLDLSIIDVDGGFISAFVQQSVNMNGEIHAVRIGENGSYIWEKETIQLTNSTSPKSNMVAVKGSGCLIISWTENGMIYSHYLKEDGSLGPSDSSNSGDINNDGSIDILDVVMLVNSILFADVDELLNADINNDGEINILDIVNLVSIILAI